MHGEEPEWIVPRALMRREERDGVDETECLLVDLGKAVL